MISRFKPAVWIAAPCADAAAAQGLAFSYGVDPIDCADEPGDWSEIAARWLREHEISGDRVLLVAGPSPRHPHANYKVELLRVSASRA
jgi:pyruvate kinase